LHQKLTTLIAQGEAPGFRHPHEDRCGIVHAESPTYVTWWTMVIFHCRAPVAYFPKLILVANISKSKAENSAGSRSFRNVERGSHGTHLEQPICRSKNQGSATVFHLARHEEVCIVSTNQNATMHNKPTTTCSLLPLHEVSYPLSLNWLFLVNQQFALSTHDEFASYGSTN
jgi:hypothetical protein